MNDLETRLHDALHDASVGPTTSNLSGPALRRIAHRRAVRARTGGFAAVGFAAVATVSVAAAPGLLHNSTTRATGTAAQTSPPASASSSPQPAGSAQPGSAQSPAPASTPTSTRPPSSVATPAAQPTPWSPAGALIDNATVRAVAPVVAATDADWTAWAADPQWRQWGGPLLAQDTVHVVFADGLTLDPTAQYPHPLVIVTGRTSPDSPILRIAALTTIQAGADRSNLNLLTVQAMTTAPANGTLAIAVSNGMTLYVVAEAGVDSATYSYTDNTGEHTAAMTITGGVAVASTPMEDLKQSPNGKITNITAYSHGNVIWDAEPIEGR